MEMRVTWQQGNCHLIDPTLGGHSGPTPRIDAGLQHDVIYNQMVVEQVAFVAPSDDTVNRIFRALADTTRRDIIRRTLSAPVNVSQLASEYEMSFAAVQKHVSVLEGAGLVIKKQQGRERLVVANPHTLQHVQKLLQSYEQIWHARIARLDAIFGEDRVGEDSR